MDKSARLVRNGWGPRPAGRTSTSGWRVGACPLSVTKLSLRTRRWRCRGARRSPRRCLGCAVAPPARDSRGRAWRVRERRNARPASSSASPASARLPDAHRAVDAGLCLRPGVVRVDLPAELCPAAREPVERAALVLDAAVGGDGRRRRWRAADTLAADELEHRAQRALGLAELAQQPARGVDLGARVVHAGDDHPARLDLRVERLEVRASGESGRRLDVERRADLVADLLAQLDLDALGAARERRVGGQEDGRDEVGGIVARGGVRRGRRPGGRTGRCA